MRTLRKFGRALRAVALTLPLWTASAAYALEADQLDDSFKPNMHPRTARLNTGADGGGVLGNRFTGSALGIDSIPNFSSYFYLPGVVPTAFGEFPQYTWQYTMVGRTPVGTQSFGDGSDSQVTQIRAPIVPVIVDLRNSDGSPRYYKAPDGTQVRMILDPTPYLRRVLASPVFSPASYSSSYRPTQYTDAVQRAEFYNTAGAGWHTLLMPVVAPARTMVLIRGTYRFAVDATGHLRYVLVDDGVFASELFPPNLGDTTTVMGQAETAGNVRTTDISTFLFANTFLYSGGDPTNCCILGYHSYDVERGDAGNGFRERRFVMNFSSWISPDIFGPTFADITALSHELSETFNDPFANNATPIWLAPNGLCQNNLEVGDVIEGLPNATFAMTMNGFTYHPQNEALVQWFAGMTPSSAIGGAYSYPDVSVLTSAAVSLHADCATPF